MREEERERGEREEKRRRWDHATIMYTRRVINIYFRSPPPAAVIRKRGSPRNELARSCERTGSTSGQFLRARVVLARESERLDLYGFSVAPP